MDKESIREGVDIVLTALQSIATLIYAIGGLITLGAFLSNFRLVFSYGFMVFSLGLIINVILATLRLWSSPLKSRSFLNFFLP